MLRRCATLQLASACSRTAAQGCSSARARQRSRAAAARFVGLRSGQQDQLPAPHLRPMLFRAVCHGTTGAQRPASSDRVWDATHFAAHLRSQLPVCGRRSKQRSALGLTNRWWRSLGSAPASFTHSFGARHTHI